MNEEKSNNIILIGMPGAGKSTIGSKLAKELSLNFMDCDDLITRYTGEPLETTIEKNGVENFLETEKNVILTVDCNNTVISTGGSVVLRDESVAHLKTLGKLIYLRLPFCALNQRIKNFESRGIAKESGETLWDIYQKRVPIYERVCDIQINCNKKSVSRIIALILEELK